MIKKLIPLFVGLVLAFYASLGLAVEANTATAAELDSVSGIGPAISQKVIDERKKKKFASWDDLISRKIGIAEKTAAKLSEGGLTVEGAPYKAGAAKKGQSKDAAKEPAKEKTAPAADAKADPKAKK